MENVQEGRHKSADPRGGGRLYAPKRTPSIRRPFDGTKLDRAYLQGFARGDLDFRRVSTLAIQVSTTTTHPDFVSLFTMLFRRYGPLYVYPCRDEVRGYRWKVAARVDNSLDFLVGEKMRPCPTFKSKGEFWSWLAGIIDSDGSVGVIHSGSYARLNLQVANQDISLLGHIKSELIRAGFFPTGPYRNYEKGYETPSCHIRYNDDMRYLLLQRSADVRETLTLLPLRHKEKKRRKDLALRLPVHALWTKIGWQVESLREQTTGETDSYVRKAKEAFMLRKHKRRGESAISRLSRVSSLPQTNSRRSTTLRRISPCR